MYAMYFFFQKCMQCFFFLCNVFFSVYVFCNVFFFCICFLQCICFFQKCMQCFFFLCQFKDMCSWAEMYACYVAVCMDIVPNKALSLSLSLSLCVCVCVTWRATTLQAPSSKHVYRVLCHITCCLHFGCMWCDITCLNPAVNMPKPCSKHGMCLNAAVNMSEHHTCSCCSCADIYVYIYIYIYDIAPSSKHNGTWRVWFVGSAAGNQGRGSRSKENRHFYHIQTCPARTRLPQRRAGTIYCITRN